MILKTRSLCRATAAFAFGAFIVALSVDTAFARCSVVRFQFKFGEQSSTTMTADSGAPCNIKLREGNGTIIKSITTVSRPARGSVTPQNSVNVAYRSRAGFQGEDRFVIAINGTKNGVRGTARVSVSVSVRNGNTNSVQVADYTARRSTRTNSKGQRGPIPNSLQMKCLQQVGASIDPVTKRYTFYATERDMMGRTDMYRLCLAGGDRQKAKGITVREYPVNPGGSIPQR